MTLTKAERERLLKELEYGHRSIENINRYDGTEYLSDMLGATQTALESLYSVVREMIESAPEPVS